MKQERIEGSRDEDHSSGARRSFYLGAESFRKGWTDGGGRDSIMNLYFLAFAPIHILPCIGIARLAAETAPGFRSHLILPTSSYLDHVNLSYTKHFDAVHLLPSCPYDRNVLRGLRGALEFRRAAGAIPIEPDSALFVTEGEDALVTLILRKLSECVRNVQRIRYIVATPPYYTTLGVRLQVKRTILIAFYSCALGLPLARFLTSKASREVGWPIYKMACETTLVFESANPARIREQATKLLGMPHPLRLLSPEDFSDSPTLPSGSILYFLSTENSVIGLDWAGYWKFHKAAFQKIQERFPDAPKFAKLHPLMREESLAGAGVAGWDPLSGKCSAEEILVRNRERIRAVYSTSSTAALIAAILGIPAYLTYPLLESPVWWQNFLEEYFDIRPPKLRIVRHWDELVDENRQPEFLDALRDEGGRADWGAFLAGLRSGPNVMRRGTTRAS